MKSINNAAITVGRLLSLTSLAQYVPALSAGVLASLSGIALIGISANLIATAALHPPLATLTLAVTGVRACGLGRATFRYLDRYFSHRLAFTCYEKLQQSAYKAAAGNIPLRAGNAREGEYLHDLLNGTVTLRNFYLRTLPQPLITGIIILAAIFFSYELTPVAALIFMTNYILHLGLAPLWLSHSAKIAAYIRTAGVEYRSALLDFVAGRKELQAAGTTSVAASSLDKLAKAYREAQDAREENLIGLQSLLDTLRQLSLVAIILLLIPAVVNGEITGIDYAVWVLVTEAILTELRSLPKAALGLADSLAAAKIILKPQQESPAKSSLPVSSILTDHDSLLAAENLSFSYDGKTPIINNLSFTISRGQHTAILGESGAGKTTLGALLLGLYPPDSGSIKYCGAAHTALTADEKKPFFSAALQGSHLFSQSIRYNFQLLLPNINEKDVFRALALAELSSLIACLPAGIDTPIGENGTRLSGGERNRLLTALALANADAPILLLDEPTTGLNPGLATKLMDNIIGELSRREQTLLLITHETSLLTYTRQNIRL